MCNILGAKAKDLRGGLERECDGYCEGWRRARGWIYSQFSPPFKVGDNGLGIMGNDVVTGSLMTLMDFV